MQMEKRKKVNGKMMNLLKNEELVNFLNIVKEFY